MQNKFPLWKNLMLIGLVLVGLLYSIPNLYTEEPAIQLSLSKSIPDNLSDNVERWLTQEKINFKSIHSITDGLEIRFPNTDNQLKAQDILKAHLDPDYTIALNLLPTTPHWLNVFGASPMKEGLDLRGGVHFLLEVDVESVIARHFEGLMKDLGHELREQSIRYSGLRYQTNQGVVIQFRDEKAFENAQSFIPTKFSNLVMVKPKSNTEGLKLILSYSPTEVSNIRQTTIEQTMSILRNRVNELGVGEAIVQQQGSTRIGVDLPGIQDAARAKQILGGTATLEFHMVDQDNDAYIAKQTGAVPISSKLYDMDGRPILLQRQIVLSGDSITSATSSFDQQTASPAVQVQLGGGGETLFMQTTRDNIGKRMAIVYVESKTIEQKIGNEIKHSTRRIERVISAPVIQNALGNNFQITGLKDIKEASDLSLLLRAGALPAAIYPIEERTVGPSLGKENIRRGMVSLEVGMGLILVVMMLYYRLFGVVANIALLLNLIFLTALLSLIGATLTLPGIAGIVLTVGMAVDANVLINERIREELRAKVSPLFAIESGYDRAFATILDANLTTLIVGIVLFSIGTGPVKGFAVTLCLGLLTSMLTAITYTRAMIQAIYGGRKNLKSLSIGI